MAADKFEAERASQIFSIEEAPLFSPIVTRIWRTRSEPINTFTSVAVTHWQMVVVKQYGRTSLFVRGPETRATTVPIPQDAEFLGIEFPIGTFMPALPIDQLVDGALVVPEAGRRSFWVNGSAWEFPTFDNADVFVNRLRRNGLVVLDPIVESALRGTPPDVSGRSLRRRIRGITGLPRKLIGQIDRAQRALVLLEQGAMILDVVARTGYADQAHLTRSLRRFIGHAPARIVRAASPRHARSR